MCFRPVLFLPGSPLCSWGLGPVPTAICLPSSSLDFFSLLLFALILQGPAEASESNKVFLTILLPFWKYYSHVCVSWITFFNFEIMFLISLCSARQRPWSSLDPTLANTRFLKDTHESPSADCCLGWNSRCTPPGYLKKELDWRCAHQVSAPCLRTTRRH